MAKYTELSWAESNPTETGEGDLVSHLSIRCFSVLSSGTEQDLSNLLGHLIEVSLLAQLNHVVFVNQVLRLKTPRF